MSNRRPKLVLSKTTLRNLSRMVSAHERRVAPAGLSPVGSASLPPQCDYLDTDELSVCLPCDPTYGCPDPAYLTYDCPVVDTGAAVSLVECTTVSVAAAGCVITDVGQCEPPTRNCGNHPDTHWCATGRGHTCNAACADGAETETC